MRPSEHLCRLLPGFVCALLSAAVWADASCRIAFDMGSSGIRAGASNSQAMPRAEIDYLGPLSAGRGQEETVAPTMKALRQLPEEGSFAGDCARVGGGFSAWRIALQQDSGQLVATLARIAAASGVAVLVIPQSVEGAYGYLGARQLLGGRLTTSHVLDIGGGSLQIAGARTSFGDQLGQKIWHRQLCLSTRNTASLPCTLQPMTSEEVINARALLANKLQGVGTALEEAVSMTAISRPVSRGVVPAVERLLGKPYGQNVLQRSALTAAIGQMAGLTLEETAIRLKIPLKYAAYLLSDMLLVEGVMQAAGADDLQIAEIDMTNVPGLLLDDRAFAWVNRYDCYLERLRRLGLDAYASDPATCAGAATPGSN